MEEKILQIAQKLFLTYGFKTVTMDDIATELSISKKTIYNFFPNKNKLVEVVANNFHSQITEGITKVKQTSKNPICLLYTSPSPRDRTRSRMPSSA